MQIRQLYEKSSLDLTLYVHTNDSFCTFGLLIACVSINLPVF